jgi:hypothetical protein
MTLMMNVISAVYYVFIAYAVVLLIINLIKTKQWEREVLYIIVLIPFLLRLLRLK